MPRPIPSRLTTILLVAAVAACSRTPDAPPAPPPVPVSVITVSAGVGIVMEFKRVDDPARIDAAADQALRQVDERWYHTELLQHGVARVLKIGMALSGKQVRMRSAMAA